MKKYGENIAREVAGVTEKKVEIFLAKINERIGELEQGIANSAGLETESVLDFKEGMMTIGDYVRLRLAEKLKP